MASGRSKRTAATAAQSRISKAVEDVWLDDDSNESKKSEYDSEGSYDEEGGSSDAWSDENDKIKDEYSVCPRWYRLFKNRQGSIHKLCLQFKGLGTMGKNGFFVKLLILSIYSNVNL